MSSNRISVYRPRAIIVPHWSKSNSTIVSRTIVVGEPLPKGYYLTEEGAMAEYARIQEHKRLAQEQYKLNRAKYQLEADNALDAIEEALIGLLKQHNTTLSFEYDGDSHGVYNERMELTTMVQGIEYRRELEI